MAFLWVKIVILVSLFTTGCTFSKKSPDEVKAEAFDEVSQRMRESTLDTREAALSVSDFQVSFEDGAEPNQYSLVVKAKRKVPKLIVIVGKRRAVEFLNTDIAQVAVHWSEVSVPVLVKTLSKDNLSAADLNLGYFDVPRDLVLSEDFYLEKDTQFVWQFGNTGTKKFRKIIFEKGVNVFTSGFNLDIDSEILEFKGENGIYFLRSVSEQPATNDIQSILYDGSNIQIRADRAFGFLEVSMKGRSGENGLSAKMKAYSQKPSPFQPARAGEAGQPAQYQEIYKTSMGPDATPSSEMICTRQPTHGTNGQDGAIIHGDDGTDGGDTGDLSIDIKDYSQARFRIFFIPGSGGLGGAGDFEGQKGGAGGAAGPGGKPCIPAMTGKAGRDSTPQDSMPGRDGRDGKIGILSIPQDARHFDVIFQLK